MDCLIVVCDLILKVTKVKRVVNVFDICDACMIFKMIMIYLNFKFGMKTHIVLRGLL